MKEYHHENLKQKLLDEGLKLLIEEGYEKFSLRKLARKCSVSHTSPYRHFKDKNELVLSIGREIQSKFNKALKKALDNTEGSQEEKIRAMGREYVYFFLSNPDFLELLFLTPEIQDISCGRHDHPEGSSFETYLSAVLPLFSQYDKGLFTIPSDPSSPEAEIPGELLRPWCLIHGLTVLLVKKALPLKDKKSLDILIDQILKF